MSVMWINLEFEKIKIIKNWKNQSNNKPSQWQYNFFQLELKSVLKLTLTNL